MKGARKTTKKDHDLQIFEKDIVSTMALFSTLKTTLDALRPSEKADSSLKSNNDVENLSSLGPAVSCSNRVMNDYRDT